MIDPASRAQQLLAAGRQPEAVATVEAACASGDVGALMLQATWRLIGRPLPRDLRAARDLLARARRIGHVDAALVEIALTANGSGAPPDWAAAVSLLEQAAIGDPLAAEHLALLRAMSLGRDGMPGRAPVSEMLHRGPDIQRFPVFCTPEEAAHIATAGAELLEPARVWDPATGTMIPHPIRSSDNAAIGPTRETLVVQAINRRIAAATATQVDQGESLTLLRYAPGQQYRPHLDTLPAAANQRVRTAILYLNQGYRGGETRFPLLGLTFAPRAGDLLVFDNLRSDGSPEPLSRHAGLPVESGSKWIATRWIRREPVSPWTLSAEAQAATPS